MKRQGIAHRGPPLAARADGTTGLPGHQRPSAISRKNLAAHGLRTRYRWLLLCSFGAAALGCRAVAGQLVVDGLAAGDVRLADFVVKCVEVVLEQKAIEFDFDVT